MRSWLSTASLFVAFAALLPLAHPASAAEECPNYEATMTAELVDGGEFDGLYKYTIDVIWEVSDHSPSHFNAMFVELQSCECVCDSVSILFDFPAGTSTGTTTGDPDGDPCTERFEGEYLCVRDPSIPSEFSGPTVKFDALNEGCEPGRTGTGTFCFYSPHQPSNPQTHQAVVKNGQDICVGIIVGSGPICPCAVPVESTTWTRIKATFR